MRTKRQLLMSRLAAIVLGGGMVGAAVTPALAIEDGESSSEGMEVMTRGPVHEAFAETVTFDPQPGIIVPKQPPALIEELMPDQRPSGDNVTWIPGYWGWEEDEADFLWISGIWRNLPPGREWVPGYWSAVDTGHQWTSGYWQDAETEEVTYLPEPPRSVERGPSVAAASDDETWIPGNWEYRQDRYAWRTGYWVNARPNWSWTPSYYRWTSCGYVYVDGYWDYPVVNRGVVFAPVRFRNNYYERPGYYYSPLAAISLSVFSNHLFVRPGYGHYYYGDYYEPGYRDRYYASCDYGSRYRGYDPIYSYNRWENRGNRNWGRERQDYYEYRRDNVDSRPPRSWAALNARPEGDRQRGDFGVVERYDRTVASRNADGRRFQSVSNEERQRFVSQRNDVRNFGRERQQREVVAGRERGGQPNRTEASRMKVSRSPVVSQRSNRSEQNGGPPARLQTRTSEQRAIAGNAGRNGNASNTGPRDQESARADRGQADNRGKNGGANPLARSMAEPNRESRTMPGQRRDPAASSKGKSQQTAEANGRANKGSGDRTEMNRKDTSSAATRGKAEPRRDANSADGSQGRPQVSNDRMPTENRGANSKSQQRQETPTARREAAPQAQRKSAPPEARNPAMRQADPSRKVTAAPTRNAAPQRAEARQQPKAQSQRQQSPRPEQRQAQPAPRRQQAAPAARQEPQRQKAQPAPQRQAARQEPQRQKAQPAPQRQAARQEPQRQRAQPAPQRQAARQEPQRQRAQPAPQRQAARSAPQPQRAAANPQTRAGSNARVEAATESKAGNKKKQQN